MALSIRLTKGQKVPLTDGRTITIMGELGTGGQGIVYRVRLDGTGEEKALKWYFPAKLKNPQEFYNRLRDKNIDKGAPSPAFVWPEALTQPVNGTFGYIMKIYPSEYKGFPKFLLGSAKFSGGTAMVDACLNIVTAFKHLHNQGWNYQDLNDGNFAINPKNGDVLICDNDNVVGHGIESGVLGKARYMAPEIVRGDAKPNKLTDRYSLAVVLFMLLTRSHPLEGAKTNVPALVDKYQKRFFGTEPVFIYDPKDNSNRPKEKLHVGALKFWPYFPDFLKNAFIQSFSYESLHKAENRLLEEQWIHVLMRLKSSLVQCPHCHDEMFLASDKATICQNCNKNVLPVGYLKFPKRTDMEVTVPLIGGVRLFDYHISNNTDNYGYENEVALVMEKPGKLGLKNESSNSWTITAPNGNSAAKQPNEIAVLGAGFKIDFGKKITAEVVVNK